jgi:hypothetical protein
LCFIFYCPPYFFLPILNWLKKIDFTKIRNWFICSGKMWNKWRNLSRKFSFYCLPFH